MTACASFFFSMGLMGQIENYRQEELCRQPGLEKVDRSSSCRPTTYASAHNPFLYTHGHFSNSVFERYTYHILVIMYRKSITTSARALRFSSRTLTQRPLLRSQFSPAPLSAVRSRLAPSIRWYSDEVDTAAKKEDIAEKKEAEESTPKAEAQDSKDANAPPDVEAELRKKLEAKEREVIDWKDKYLRSVADFRNLQDRAQRDMKGARDFAIQNFAKDLVDSVDNLDRALLMGKDGLKEEDGSENEGLRKFYDGVKMTETNMLQTLSKHGLERFDPEGAKFNPNEHEATFMTPVPDKEVNTVFHVQQKGFKLNGRVLRAAKVGVVKGQ
ncbi:GrpE-domain-containing protein [Xylariaceae sp. FL0662B]|nr:GrpE-domain-containing protein [Xylariaceae sp. FL0662B]